MDEPNKPDGPSAMTWLEDPIRGVVQQVRPAQITMAQMVTSALKQADPAKALFVEAPTGTGKSYAYLLPVLSEMRSQRVVVSTGNKALQTQLVQKDLPRLQQVTGLITRARLLKGKGNYACQLRIDEARAKETLAPEVLNDLDQWLHTHSTGDLEEYPKATAELADQTRVTDCMRRRCPNAEDCPYLRHLDDCKTAPVLVVNHALLAFDLWRGGRKLLGKYQALIIDEAHRAPRFFREAYTTRMFLRQPERWSRWMHDSGLKLPDTLVGLYREFFGLLPNQNQRITPDNCKPEHQNLLNQIVTDCEKALTSIHTVLGDSDDFDDDSGGTMSREEAQSRAQLRMVREQASAVSQIVTRLFNGQAETDKVPYVVYLEPKSNHNARPDLCAKPVLIGPLVGPVLAEIGKVVITSATLATSNKAEGFDYMRDEFGLYKSQVFATQIVPHTFKYGDCSGLYLTQDVPDPTQRSRDYYIGLAKVTHSLLSASKGGAFILCTSREDMNNLGDALVRDHFSPDYDVATQSNADPAELLQWFLKAPNRVLIGLDSFWEGVDVAGLFLRLVIIPRLPFPNPMDPLHAARKETAIADMMEREIEEGEAGRRVWLQLDLQECIMKLKQGAGRLIRSATDMGIVALLDSRAMPGGGKRYAYDLVRALPHPKLYDRNGVTQFLSLLAAQVEKQTARVEGSVELDLE